MSAAIDISFLRALNTPCTCPTSVLSVSRTTRLAESAVCRVKVSPFRALIRSEEHTSELQSRLHLVCRLLLEKKKKKKTLTQTHTREIEKYISYTMNIPYTTLVN